MPSGKFPHLKGKGELHFLWPKNPKLHLHKHASATIPCPNRVLGSSTSSTRRRGAEDCAFAPNRFVIVYPRNGKLEEEKRATPGPHRLSCEKTGILWVLWRQTVGTSEDESLELTECCRDGQEMEMEKREETREGRNDSTALLVRERANLVHSNAEICLC